MAIPSTNALEIQLPKYHNNEDLILHIRQLTKVCVTNGENTKNKNLQYFPNSLKGRIVNQFERYETTHPITTWVEVQCVFITWFNEIKTKGQVPTTLRYVKQKKYETVEDYYDRFLQLCTVTPQQLNDIYLR